MVIHQIADQLLATSHMPGNKTRVPNFRGNHTLIAKMGYLYCFSLVLLQLIVNYISIERRERLVG